MTINTNYLHLVIFFIFILRSYNNDLEFDHVLLISQRFAKWLYSRGFDFLWFSFTQLLRLLQTKIMITVGHHHHLGSLKEYKNNCLCLFAANVVQFA